MASSLTRSLRRAAEPSTREERSPLMHGRRQESDENGGSRETCLSGEHDRHTVTNRTPQPPNTYGVIVREPRIARSHGNGTARHSDVVPTQPYTERPPVPMPRTRRRTQYDTLRACQSAGLTQAEFMERSRYVRTAARGDPAHYDEDLYAPIPARQRNREAEVFDNAEVAAVEADIYSSVQQHERILENIRLQPWPIAERKQYRLIMMSSLENHVGRLDAYDSVNHAGHKAVSYASKKLSTYATSHGFLSSWIKKIEGHFGTGVASFFVFLRSLFFLNILTSLFTGLFIMFPQLAFGKGNTNVNNGDTLEKLYNSFVFYGYYDNDTELNASYDLPAAYLTVNLALFLMCFLMITYVMKRRYQATKRLTSDTVACPFALKVFTFWDYTITEKESSSLKGASIGVGLREDLRELVEARRRNQISFWLVLFVRLVVNVIVLVLLAGSGYVVYFFVKRDQDRTEFSDDKFVALVEQFELPFILAALKLVGPVVFEKLVLLEKFHPRVAFKWTMSRTMVLYLGNLAVLTVTLLMKASRQNQCGGDDSPTELPVTSSSPSVAPSTSTSGRPSPGRDACCWESLVGEELLKVVIIDFGAILLAVLMADVIREVITRRSIFVREKIGRGEFQVAVSVLDMVYGQGLVWIGTFFSPILPLFAFAKTFLLFFFYYYTTMFSHAAPKKIFRASRSGNFLLLVLQVTLFLCLLPLLYVFSRLPPSANCGPFRSQRNLYDVITDHFSQATNDGIGLIGTPVVLVPLLLLCLSAIVYYRLLMTSYEGIVKDLRTQLHFELVEDWNQEKPVFPNQTTAGTSSSHSGDDNTSRHSSGHQSQRGSIVSQLTTATTVNSAITARQSSSSSQSSETRPQTQPHRDNGGRKHRIIDEPLPQPPV